MNGWLRAAVIVLAGWNISVFALYGVDKRNAKRGMRRIRERTLLWSAALLGAAGAFCGMCVFRHKTKHANFMIGVPLLLLIHLAVIAFLILRFPALTP